MQHIESSRWWLAVVSAVRPARVLLDIGPGIQPQTLVACETHLCVEPYFEYSEILTREHPECTVISATWAEAIALLPTGSVDTVVLLDVIEHLEKDEGRRLLDATVALARSQVVVFTPLGFAPQGADEDTDAWGLGGTEWQIHRSGWLPEDFPEWNVLVCEKYRTTDAYGRSLDKPMGVLLAVLDVGTGTDAGYELHREQRRKIRQRVSQMRATQPLGIPRRLIRKLKHVMRLER